MKAVMPKHTSSRNVPRKGDSPSRKRRKRSKSPGNRAHHSRSHRRRSYSRSPRTSNDRRRSHGGEVKVEEDRRNRSKGGQDVDAIEYKSYFDRMFFRDTDIIRRGTQEYEDFWKFYQKFQLVKKAKGQGQTSQGPEEKMPSIRLTSDVKIPGGKFTKKLTVPFDLKVKDPEEYIRKLNPDDEEYLRDNVPVEVVNDFLQILLYYLDFQQKERFNKLKKLRLSQEALPIAQFRDNIVDTLAKSNVLIVAGDTGCGKSTQVPQYLLRAGYTKIACTQPRRIACISLCKRVAYETLNEYGSEIGYQIRFEKSKTQSTKLVFLTEGLLLRQVCSDSMLTNYNVVVLDEVHERHLHGDFLLGIIKCLLYQRTDVKVILMSATINTELFQNYFQGLAPIIQVPGRLYPIKMQYRPVSVEELNSRSGKLNPAPYVRILQLIDDKFPNDERGDVLIFLSGMNEISTVEEAAKLYAEQTKRWIVLPLHSSLSISDQDKAFDYPPEGIRKCIISTNIAETSITIDGIRFVVDSGKVKEMAYDPSCKLQRLKEFWISKASAEQRKGRAGRTGPGVCYRLYSETEYNELQAYSTPEIQRVPLDSLLLQMISLGIPDCRKFPFIEPPSQESIESSILRLQEQAAVTDQETLTPIGKTLSQLPVDVTIGKMLIMGTVFDQIDAVLSLAAALSVQTPFTNWAHRDPNCVAARKSLDSDHGDPLTLLNAYRAWLEEKADPEANTRKWCKRRGFEEQRFYEMTKLRQQFKTLLTDSKLIQDSSTDPAAMSSSERALRHGEMKKLRDLKREYHTTEPRKKRVLKMLDSDLGNDDADLEEDSKIDIRDIEFRMKNDHRKVKDLLHQSTPFGYEDVMILKLILCSGLYPQLAVADDFNKHKNDIDQVFHTKGKGFTVLHPMSIFANQPDVLRLTDADIISVPGMHTNLAISSKHQLLYYLTLLETNKPYLMNSFRMPAIQSLLLFAHSIDTDPGFGRIVFDSWLEVEVSDAASARAMIITALELRNSWSQLLAKRLKSNDELTAPIFDAKGGRELAYGLVIFMRTDVFYTIKRLLAADQKDMYDKHFKADKDDTDIQLEAGFDMNHNVQRGGLAVTSFLNYGSLYGAVPEPEQWTCPICEAQQLEYPLQLFLHHVRCRSAKQRKMETEIAEEELKTRPFAKAYTCPQCDQQLHLTPLEILRHKKNHASDS